MYSGKIPFTVQGHQLDWVGRDASTYYDNVARGYVGVDWRDNVYFREVMKLTGSTRGRSAANFEFEDEQGRTYNVFLSDMVQICKEYGIKEGKTDRLEWCFRKQGQSYGLCLGRV